jgi:hypothetical protein
MPLVDRLKPETGSDLLASVCERPNFGKPPLFCLRDRPIRYQKKNRRYDLLGNLLIRRDDRKRIGHAAVSSINPSVDLEPTAVHAGHTNKALQTVKYPDELESTMEKIIDQARLSEEEAGISTLFLAFGFLEWYESDDSDKAYYAPLLLLPVKVKGSGLTGKPVFSIQADEEEAETNVSLQKFLETTYGRTLRSFGFDQEEAQDNIESYLAAVGQTIEGLKRWKVRRWLTLGHFAFSRIAIYQDTDPEKWPTHPAETTLVGPLLAGYETEDASLDDLNGDLLGSSVDYDLETLEMEAIAPYLVQDADASQHSALIDVMKGKSIVIQGPPGTGKSQTITNIIGNALAANKSVLFLAEKQAALDVVKRRLDSAGLGDFCLELHSDKVSPKSVVASIGHRAAQSYHDIPVQSEDYPTAG